MIFYFSFFFDDRMWTIMPVAWYLATKACMYSTWFLYLHEYILLLTKQQQNNNIILLINHITMANP